MKIVNYRLKRFVTLPNEVQDEYINFLQYLRPYKKICNFTINKLSSLSYGKIKDCQTLLKKGCIIELVQKVTGFSDRKISNLRIIELYHFINYLTKELEQLIETENNALSYAPEPDEIIAGVDNFNKFGIFGLVRLIAIRYSQTPEWVLNRNYEWVFTELLYDKTEANYQKRLNDIKFKK